MTDTYQGDIIRRGLRRDQPVKLTKDELLEKMTAFTVKDAERDELTDELVKETKKRKQQIEELDDEIGLIKRCIRTGEEDRSVVCFERLDRRSDGTWEVVLIRSDTNAVVERRSAHAAELQRHLPSEYAGQQGLDLGGAGRAPADDAPADAPGDGGDDVPDEDEGDENGTGKEKVEKFHATLLADGKCALRFEGGNGCTLEVGHKGLHKSATHSWKARRPKPPEATSGADGPTPTIPGNGMVAEAIAKEQQP